MKILNCYFCKREIKVDEKTKYAICNECSMPTVKIEDKIVSKYGLFLLENNVRSILEFERKNKLDKKRKCSII